MDFPKREDFGKVKVGIAVRQSANEKVPETDDQSAPGLLHKEKRGKKMKRTKCLSIYYTKICEIARGELLKLF